MYLIDTNICIYSIKKKPEIALKNIKKHMGKGIFISALTIAELEYGAEYSDHVEENRVAMFKFVSPFSILKFDDKDAYEYGKIKTRLRKMGKIIGPIDMLLAAQAKARNLVMVTNNVDEFSRIDDLEIEDWSKE